MPTTPPLPPDRARKSESAQLDRKQSPWPQFIDLFHIELLNWRWGWRPLVLTGMLLPVILIVLLGYVTGTDAETSRHAHILTGNVTVALMFTNMRRMSTRFAWMREAGTLDYYATLPVHRYLVVVAVLCAFCCPCLRSWSLCCSDPFSWTSRCGCTHGSFWLSH